MIPYCANCSRKIKIDGLDFGKYYCDVVANTPMKGIITPDIDGSQCLNNGCYIPINT